MASVTTIKKNGLDCVQLTHSSGASALVYVYGAHLASWQTSDGAEQLFVSSKTEYGGGTAIRGGVPICWPQFADRGPLPKHGLCRNSAEWQVVRTSSEPYPCVVLGLSDTEATRAAYPSSFSLRYSVTLDGPESLSTALMVQNTGDAPLEFTGALHTYLRCEDAAAVRVQGLQGLQYEDSTKGGAVARQEEPLLSIAGEVDRVYLGAPAEAYVIEVILVSKYVYLVEYVSSAQWCSMLAVQLATRVYLLSSVTQHVFAVYSTGRAGHEGAQDGHAGRRRVEHRRRQGGRAQGPGGRRVEAVRLLRGSGRG